MKCFESVACLLVCVCKQKTAYEMRISDWSSDVCASDLTRGRAKTINFAILYGISAFGLAGRLGCDRGEAQAIIDRYFDRFPGIRNYIAETLSGARESGYVTTLFGRRTHFPRSEEHTSELQSLMRISYAVFCLKKQKQKNLNSLQSM